MSSSVTLQRQKLVHKKMKWCSNSSKAVFMGNIAQIAASLSQCKHRVIFSMYSYAIKDFPKMKHHLPSPLFWIVTLWEAMLKCFFSCLWTVLSFHCSFSTYCVSPTIYYFYMNITFMVTRQGNLFIYFLKNKRKTAFHNPNWTFV